jgi:hypothetical protein
VFKPNTTVQLVPGKVGEFCQREHFKNCRPRQGDFVYESVEVKVQVIGEGERTARVRKDEANMFQILGHAFTGEEFPVEDKLKLLTKPFKMEDGAVFKLERVETIVKLSLDYTTWDNRLLRFGVEVSAMAMISEIVAAAQRKAEEQLEEAKFYTLYQKGRPSVSPWTQAIYELKPNTRLATVVTAKTREGDMTVAVPTDHPEVWQRVVFQALANPP